MTIDIQQFKTQFPLILHLCTESNIQALLEKFTLINAPAGVKLTEYNSYQDTLYFVTEGVLAVSIPNEQQQLIQLGQIGPGQWVGDVSAIDPGPASAYLEILEDAKLLALSYADLADLRHNHPRLAGKLIQALSLELADRIRQTTVPLFEHDKPNKTTDSLEMNWLTEAGRRIVGHKTDILNRELHRLIEQKQNEIAQKFESLRDEENDRVLAEERERIMRDMHDGVGGQLVTTLSLVEKGGVESEQLAELLRNALTDLRLMIDSFDPIDDDLPTLLGIIRHRVASQLQSHGIKLQWQITDLPPIPMLGPNNILQILRILQETFTNILKHSKADDVTVQTGIIPAADGTKHAFIDVSDNGIGIKLNDMEKRGSRGLKNMKNRASEIGCSLQINSDSRLTNIRLLIPI